MDCHGNHAISHNLFGLMFENNRFCFAMVPMINLASIPNYHRGERYVLLSPGSYFLAIAYFLLSNDFPVIFQVYMNIHDYAKEKIFI